MMLPLRLTRTINAHGQGNRRDPAAGDRSRDQPPADHRHRADAGDAGDLNPKNLALTVAAATTIAEAGISSGQEAGVMVIFVALGSLTILAPLVIYFALGAKAAGILDGIKNWMAAHNAAIMAVILLVLGVKLIGDAISGLSS
jgi:hypothetical protein